MNIVQLAHEILKIDEKFQATLHDDKVSPYFDSLEQTKSWIKHSLQKYMFKGDKIKWFNDWTMCIVIKPTGEKTNFYGKITRTR